MTQEYEIIKDRHTGNQSVETLVSSESHALGQWLNW
tara:strand:+ start:586 stop:693 length:108 start_codon:yes stop_codon:yes gene_type:complete